MVLVPESFGYTVRMNSIPHPYDFTRADACINLLLPMLDASVRAGFPSPAADFGETRIDLMAELITHPQAT